MDQTNPISRYKQILFLGLIEGLDCKHVEIKTNLVSRACCGSESCYANMLLYLVFISLCLTVKVHPNILPQDSIQESIQYGYIQ